MPDTVYNSTADGVFQEALDFLKQKKPIPAGEYRKLQEETRARAFTVSGYTTVEILEEFLRELEAAIEKGTTRETFRENINRFLEDRGYAGMDPWHADVIFRTNLQTAYNAGHYRSMSDPTVRKLRPYWQYRTAGDGHVRQEHAVMERRIYRAEDPVWDVWYPPNGFRCRCSVVSLTEEQVKAQGRPVEQIMPHEIDTETGEAVFYWPDKGFTGNPAKTVFKPDMQEIRPDLKRVYRDAQKERRRKRAVKAKKDSQA